MISISSSASLEYYLEDAFEEIGADPKIGLRSGKKENYYAGSSNKADPLARPLTVGGPAATKLGLKHGQKLSAKQFENLYFGYTPDGRQPLHEKIKTKEEQTAASKKVRACEVARDAGYAERRAALDAAEKRLGDKSLALTDPAVVEADAKIARAKAALDEARNEKNGYRRPGVDVVLSLPADMNILHASFLAQGKLDKAKKLEDFFNKAADRACEKLAAKCTSSSGGKDENGKRIGEPVDVIWTSTTHFDARPDENGVVSHNIHRHANFLNVGRKEDGTWGAIRTEELEAARHEVDAELVASCTQFCVSEFGVDPTAKEFETGVLGVEFGAGRHLETLKEKPQSGIVSRLFGRKSEVQKNKEKGLSGAQLNRVGRQEKKKLTGDEHIAMQRELLAEAGLTLGKIKGSKKERLADERAKAAERLTRQYDNEGKKWSEFERAHGFPDGKPKPFTGKKATKYIEFTKMVKERRAAGDKSVPPSPIVPPGEIGHSPAFWNECLDKAVQHEIKQQESRTSLAIGLVVDHLTQTEPSFTASQLREEVARRVAFQPPEKGFLGLKKLTDDELLDSVERKVDRICREIVESDLVVASKENGKKVYVSSGLREQERKAYGETLPALFKTDKNGRHMTQERANEFVTDWEKKQGFAFSPKQRKAIKALATSQTKGQCVIGWAGSGKSAMAGCAVGTMKELGYEVIACAPSNSAAEILRKELKADAGLTPQKLLLEMKAKRITLGPKTLIYLDEVSMLDLKSGSALLEAVEASGARIVFSGDPKQLESVGAGNLLDHVLRTAKEADKSEPDGGQRFIELNSTYTDAQTIQRQALRAGRQLTAEMQTGNWTAAFRTLKAGGMLETATTESECILKMCSDYKESMKKHVGDTPRLMAAWEEAKRTGTGVDTARARLEESLMSSAEGYRKNVMLAETNANVRALGAKARADLKELGLLGKEDTEIVGEAGKMKIAVGERLSLRGKLTTRDAIAYDSFLYTKGTQLTVVDIRKDKDGSPILSVRVDSADAKDGVVRLDIRAEDFKALAPATAMTVHLSQGGSWDNVGYLPSAKSTKPALLLVGMTRHKKALKTFVPDADVKTLEKKAQKTTRRPDALDYDELSEAELDTAVEVVSRATDRAVDAATKDAQSRALETFEKAMARPEAGMAETAHALGAAASALKREDVAKAAKSGVVAIGENAALPHLAEDRRTWLAETSDSCLAYNPKTGRVEAWKKEKVDDARKTLAVRSEVHAKMAEAIRDAVPEAEEARKSEYDVRGELVARGVDPFKNVAGEKETAWAEIKKDDGEVVKVWGVDIGKALDEAGLKVGDGVSLNGDATKDVTVYSSKGDEGGAEGKLITPPSKKGPAEVSLDGGKKKVKVYGAAGDAWKDAKPGDSITVYSKTVEKRLWTAESHALPNKLDIEKRKAAWDAARRAVENDALFDTLRAVGVGAKATANDSEQDEKKRALRNWTAGGDGADAVVEWDANLGPGQKAWHEVGRLEKGDDDIARADLTGVVLHDDGARIYYALAVENGRGDVETAGQRILAFEKEDLGLSNGTCRVGSTHRIRCSDDEEMPALLTPKDEIAFEPEAPKKETAADAEAEFIEQAVQQMLDRLTTTELKELAERKVTGPTEAQLREAAERPNETLSEVGLISDTPLMNDGMLKPTPEETAQREAARLAAEAIENARRTDFSERKAQAEAWAARVNAGEAKRPVDRQSREEAEARATEEANERRAQKELEYLELADDILSIKNEALRRKTADSLTEDEKDDMLLAAAKVEEVKTVKALIKLGFNAERTLHKAVSDGRASDVEALVAAGADPHKQVNGLTAAELADGLSENGKDAKRIDSLLKEIGVAEPAAAATQTATQVPKARGPK